MYHDAKTQIGKILIHWKAEKIRNNKDNYDNNGGDAYTYSLNNKIRENGAMSAEDWDNFKKNNGSRGSSSSGGSSSGGSSSNLGKTSNNSGIRQAPAGPPEDIVPTVEVIIEGEQLESVYVNGTGTIYGEIYELSERLGEDVVEVKNESEDVISIYYRYRGRTVHYYLKSLLKSEEITGSDGSKMQMKDGQLMVDVKSVSEMAGAKVSKSKKENEKNVVTVEYIHATVSETTFVGSGTIQESDDLYVLEQGEKFSLVRYARGSGYASGWVSNDTLDIVNGEGTSDDNMQVSQEYIDFLKQYETFEAEAYRGQDSQNQTIGYGHVILPGESFGTLTVSEAEELLKSDLQSRVDYVNQQAEKYGLELNQHEFDGLVDMVFNKGNILTPDSATFFKLIVEDSDDTDEIFYQFSRWNKVNGEFSLGVYRRSTDSADIFLNGDYTRDYRDTPDEYK